MNEGYQSQKPHATIAQGTCQHVRLARYSQKENVSRETLQRKGLLILQWEE